MVEKKTMRCAIYTRKSSEEGLDQDFNSLDAQREACEAYIKSQKAEGWKLLSGRFDDGGHSGGTLERPALQDLMADIDAGRIDMVVVYKIDRLTRSLSDFAKLIDKLEAAGTRFVSVTQAFNTSTSMGRLTLNVLLSFAQFEREVTAERIRDKIAASKKKGMWMGGLTPLGYDSHDRSLVINKTEAKIVCKLFDLYLELGNIRCVKGEADRLGILSKRRKYRSGHACGGAPLSRGMIHHLLTNPVYIGRIKHKDKSYPGNHDPIIDQEKWEQVQRRLIASASRPRRMENAKSPSPLAGKLFDETGDRLTPSHAGPRPGSGSGSRRHRYYVSRRLIKQSGEKQTGGWRLPARTLEAAVIQAVTEHLLPALCNGLQRADFGIDRIEALHARDCEISAKLKEGDSDLLASIIERVEIAPGELKVRLDAKATAKAFDVTTNDLAAASLEAIIPFQLRRRGVEAKLIIGESPALPDLTMIKAIARSISWRSDIQNGIGVKAIARRDGVTDGFVRKMLKLAFLSPLIIETILNGRQPTEITLEKLVTNEIPLQWSEQVEMFGFDTL